MIIGISLKIIAKNTDVKTLEQLEEKIKGKN